MECRDGEKGGAEGTGAWWPLVAGLLFMPGEMGAVRGFRQRDVI